MARRRKSSEKGDRSKRFVQGDWEATEDTDNLEDTMSRALTGVMDNPDLDMSKEQVAKVSAMIAVEMLEAFDALMEDAMDFEDDGRGIVWSLFLATITPVVTHANPDDFRSAEGLTEMASTCTVHAMAAWSAFAKADRDEDDGDCDDDDEDDDDGYGY